MNVARFNFSHGEYDWFRESFDIIRKVSAQLLRQCSPSAATVTLLSLCCYCGSALPLLLLPSVHHAVSVALFFLCCCGGAQQCVIP